mgnify:CR=1 FL=1|tara:strand:- start:41 stop:190 length:150 start_codon:yes stop_codon:yes gene_type:complete
MGYTARKKEEESQKEIRRKLDERRRRKEMYDDKGKLKNKYKNRKKLNVQ